MLRMITFLGFAFLEHLFQFIYVYLTPHKYDFFSTFQKKDVYRKAMEEYFPSDVGVRLLAAPGTFFIKSALYLTANVIAKRATKEGM